MSVKNKIEGFRRIWQFDNRWQLIAMRIFPHEPINIYRIGGLQMLADHSTGDANGAHEVIATPMYRKFFGAMQLISPLKVLDT
jgi:hypothetical protein